MREFYLFEIKSEVIKKFNDNYEGLYNVLFDIHYLKSEDIVLGFKIFDSIVKPMNKELFNQFIKEKNLSNESYMCYKDSHTINDFSYNETTKMIINNSHIKIKSNKNIPSFFYNIRKFRNIFVCDFDNHDYFLLDETCISYF